ncbi:MAG: hypothetical protein JNL43_04180 [Flavobacteriales bacterium]|nr:hypothetical protein [Flavobacteriales bacterium]
MKKAHITMWLTAFVPLQAAAVLSVQVTNVEHETCTYASGEIWVEAVGGVPPYTYAWTDGPTTNVRGGLSAGSYTVTVTDANSDQASTTVDIFSYPYQLTAAGGGVAWCYAPGNVLEDPAVSGVPNNWTVNGNPAQYWGPGQFGENYLFHPDPWPTNFNYTVDDGNGCTGTISGMSGPQVTNWPELTVTNVVPSCSNEDVGAIKVHSAGPAPAGLTWLALIQDGEVVPPNAYQPDPITMDVNFVNLEPGYYGITWWLGHTAEAWDPGECVRDTIWVTVPDLGSNCGSVQGTSFIDLDGNCVQDANEVGVPFSPLLVQPTDQTILTNGNGQFAFGLPNGSYTLEQTDPTLVPICPATQPVPFDVNSNVSSLLLANGSTEPLDLRASISGSVFRPGFDSHYHVSARNDSPQQSGPVTVTLELDPVLTYVASGLAPTINGNTLTWSLPAFTSYQWEHWYVTVNVPVGTPLGTELSSTLTVSNTLPDANAANNIDIDIDIVVGSYDPNDKRAVTSSRASESLYFINADEWIDYTIRFQNTGTFPADFVVITDTIAPELDMLTFEQGVVSHPFDVSFKPGRVIEWRFDDIQLPDSASDEPGSHGLVKFRMKPRLPLVAGTSIENTANIYFDFNEPVITEPSVLTAEFSTGVHEGSSTPRVTVVPNPAIAGVEVQCNRVDMRYVSILAADGRRVHGQRVSGKHANIDIAGFAAGMYMLLLEGSDGATYRTSFIKQEP